MPIFVVTAVGEYAAVWAAQSAGSSFVDRNPHSLSK